MNSRNSKSDLTLEEVKEKIVDYTDTIHAMQAFISIVTWDDDTYAKIPDSKYSFGRTMDTSQGNPISPNSHVTPDIVVQRNQKLGYVVEAKKSLNKDQSLWVGTVEQIRKYDDNLTGWWTSNELISQSCIVLLLHQFRVVSFEKFFHEHMDTIGEIISHPFSIVEFSRSGDYRTYIYLRRTQRSLIEDANISLRLEEGIPVPIENVVRSYGTMKFYDARPVLEHIMAVLWNDVFNNLRTSSGYDEKLRAYPIDIDVGTLTQELQNLYGSKGGTPREHSFPQISWVREAMDSFVTIDLAKHIKNSKYLVKFKELRTDDLIEYFYKQRRKKGNLNNELPKQLSLFTKETSEEENT